MRIVVLHGQSHKGSTYHLAKLFCDKLGGEVTEFFLPRDFGAFCVGCSQCFSQSEQLCPHADQLRPITEALDAADVIVLASPVYVYHVTGPMKALLDHYGYRWMVHRPQEGIVFQAGGVPVHRGGGRNAAHQPGPGRQRFLLGDCQDSPVWQKCPGSLLGAGQPGAERPDGAGAVYPGQTGGAWGGKGAARPADKGVFYPNSVDAEAGLERSRPGILAGKRLDRARPSLEESLTLLGARGEVLAPNDGQMDGFVLQ